MSTPEIATNNPPLQSDNLPGNDPSLFSPETPPRKRGRPSNAEKAAREAQAKIDGANPAKQADAKAKTKAAKAGKTFVEPNIDKLAKQLMGVHAIADKFLDKLTGIPCLALTEPESYALAESVVGMSREFEIVVSSRTAAMVQLALTVGMIYGPRYLYFADAVKTAKRNGLQSPDDDVPHNTAG